MVKRTARTILTLALLFATAFVAIPTAQAAVSHRPIVTIGANQSTNWSGYNQGALEKRKLFTSITGDWTVPTATQHTARQAAFSSTWIGIGGGCVETSCTVPDGTLIQEGTEQDVAANGAATYYAWFELIPAPSIKIGGFAVRPGDRIHASIQEVVPYSNVWSMKMTDLTTGKSWSQTLPYTSTHATAEWIEETPLVFGTGGAGISSMPNLSAVNFDLAIVNGKPAGLNPTEEIQLVTSKHAVVATPSPPDSDADGFNVCTYASSCGAPGS